MNILILVQDEEFARTLLNTPSPGKENRFTPRRRKTGPLDSFFSRTSEKQKPRVENRGGSKDPGGVSKPDSPLTSISTSLHEKSAVKPSPKTLFCPNNISSFMKKHLLKKCETAVPPSISDEDLSQSVLCVDSQVPDPLEPTSSTSPYCTTALPSQQSTQRIPLYEDDVLKFDSDSEELAPTGSDQDNIDPSGDEDNPRDKHHTVEPSLSLNETDRPGPSESTEVPALSSQDLLLLDPGKLRKLIKLLKIDIWPLYFLHYIPHEYQRMEDLIKISKRHF